MYIHNTYCSVIPNVFIIINKVPPYFNSNCSCAIFMGADFEIKIHELS